MLGLVYFFVYYYHFVALYFFFVFVSVYLYIVVRVLCLFFVFFLWLLLISFAGLYSVYTHWRSIEIMFHVSTLLPYEKVNNFACLFASRFDDSIPFLIQCNELCIYSMIHKSCNGKDILEMISFVLFSSKLIIHHSVQLA